MKTVVLGPRPAELDALLDRRHALGQDRFDEVWEGEYHMVPGPRPAHGYIDKQLGVILDPYARAAGLIGLTAFNLGSAADSFRVPDGGYFRTLPTEIWIPSASVVVEILSPDDETFAKFDFFAGHGVEEVLVVDPEGRSARCWRLVGTAYDETRRSELLALDMTDLEGRIDWPDVRNA